MPAGLRGRFCGRCDRVALASECHAEGAVSGLVRAVLWKFRPEAGSSLPLRARPARSGLLVVSWVVGRAPGNPARTGRGIKRLARSASGASSGLPRRALGVGYSRGSSRPTAVGIAVSRGSASPARGVRLRERRASDPLPTSRWRRGLPRSGRRRPGWHMDGTRWRRPPSKRFGPLAHRAQRCGGGLPCAG